MYIDKNMEEIKEKGVIFDINFTPPINLSPLKINFGLLLFACILNI